tara:strand:- start:767 stop:979 length:213 start_codon:yes stop_codon:yes gene_type:complete
MENEEQTITINDVTYHASDLSEECIAELASVKYCDEELMRLQYKTAAIKTAKNAYSNRANELLPKDKAKH